MVDTIYALATARGKAGVAVIRISGSRAVAAAAALAGSVPEPRLAQVRLLRDADGSPLDQALVLRFEAGASFTGEDVVELQLHGSNAVVAAVLRRLSDCPGLRLADPGEFTRRALEHNRMDLSQVEGLADLIDAETEAQRRQALRVMQGALGEKAGRWRSALIRALALLEVTIDFADEEVPVDVAPDVLEVLAEVRSEIGAELAGARAARAIRRGFEVAIVGRPNVGKSTLLNALAGREAAITSEIAGTTRDVIEVFMDIKGLAVTLLDTAGLRETEDAIESIGVDRARKRAEAADLRIFLSETTGDFSELGVAMQPGDIVATAKADLHKGPGLAVSGMTGRGIDQLLDGIAAALAERVAWASSAIRERHRVALRDADAALESAETQVRGGADRIELAAEDLRQGMRALDMMIGRVDVENVLDEIFASFCLGK